MHLYALDATAEQCFIGLQIHVFQDDPFEGLFQQALDLYRSAGTAARYIPDLNILTHTGRLCFRHDGAGLVEHIDLYRLIRHIMNLYVFDLHIFHISATSAHRFQTYALHCILNLAIVRIHISHTAGYRASDHNPAVPAVHKAVSNLDILTGPVHPPSVLIHARIDGNAVIPRLQRTSFDKNIPAGIRVDPIRIMTGCAHLHVSNDDILTVYGMNRPLRAIHDREAFQENVFAVDHLYELRAKRVLFRTEDPLFYWYAVHCHLV